MANSSKGAKTQKKRPTALKRELQNKVRHQRHRAYKSRVRSALRHLEESLSQKDQEKTESYKNLVFSLMDKGACKGIYKKNKSSRVKARVSLRCAKVLAA